MPFVTVMYLLVTWPLSTVPQTNSLNSVQSCLFPNLNSQTNVTESFTATLTLTGGVAVNRVLEWTERKKQMIFKDCKYKKVFQNYPVGLQYPL